MTGDATRALQYSLAIPVISHGPVESFKVSLLEKDSTIKGNSIWQHSF